MNSGAYVDAIEIVVSENSQEGELRVDLVSVEFDPVLDLISPSGEVLQNDDWLGQIDRSRISVQEPEIGVWTIRVSSYSGGDTGSYIARVSGHDRWDQYGEALPVEQDSMVYGSPGNEAYSYWTADIADLSSLAFDSQAPLFGTPITGEGPDRIPGRAHIVDFWDGTYWMLAQDLVWEVDDGVNLVVPAGFVTDLTSTPPAIWSMVAPTGRHQRAAILHDYLYWTQECSRFESDGLMRRAMDALGVNPVKSIAVHRVLNLAGWGAWNGNAREWRAGQPRIIPRRWRSIDDEWPSLRRRLQLAGVNPGTRPARGAYCDRG